MVCIGMACTIVEGGEITFEITRLVFVGLP